MKKLCFSFLLALAVSQLVWGQEDGGQQKKDTPYTTYKKQLKSKIPVFEEKFKSNDSVFSEYRDFRDRLKSNLREKIRYELKKTVVYGEISAFHKYGILTEYLDTTSEDPLQVYGSRGDIHLNTFNVPFTISYNYASYKNPIGVNNYIRFSYDFDQVKKPKAGLGETDLYQKMKKQLEENKKVQNELKSSMGYSEILQQGAKEKLEKNLQEAAKQELEKQKCSDSTSQASSYCDSINLAYESSRQKISELQQELDTLEFYYNKAMSLYDEYSYASGVLKEQSDFIKNSGGSLYQTKLNEKFSGFMSNFSKFDLGLTAPSTTGLSSNSVPMNGLNFEVEKKRWYLNVAAGTLMNNLVVTNDLVQNQLQNQQNLFNQFDFQEIREKPFLAHVKGGYGSKNKTHAFLGFNYLTKNGQLPDQKQGLVTLELDMRYAPERVKGLNLDLIAGRTNRRDSLVAYSVFDKNTETGFALVKASYAIDKVKSDISLSLRTISSFAETKAFGVLQPDNRRLELKTRHKIGKKNTLSLFYRHDRNNLDARLDSTIYLNLYGAQLNSKITRAISAFASINFVVQQSSQAVTEESRKLNSNYIFNSGINYSYSIKKTQHIFSVLYNDLQLTTLSGLNRFENYSIQQSSMMGRSRNLFSAGYFKRKMLQEETEAFIVSNDLSFDLKKMLLTVGVRYSNSKEFGHDFGGKLDLKFNILKVFRLSFTAEKLVYGSYYNYYNPEQFQRFPYVLVTTLTYNLKR